MAGTRAAAVALTLSCVALASGRATEAAGPASTSGGAAPASTSVAPAPEPAAISVGEIATRAAEVPGLLRSLSPPPSVQIQSVEKQLPEMRERIDAEQAAAASILRGEPTMDTLQVEEQLWQRRLFETKQWLTFLTQRAKLLHDSLNRLAQIEKTWRETRDAAETSRAPGSLLEEIDGSLAAIASTREALEAQRATILSLQSAVVKEVERSEDLLAQVARAQEAAVEGIFNRQGPAIWSPEGWTEARTVLSPRIREIAAGRFKDIARYIGGPEGMPRHGAILVALVLAMLAVRRRVREWARSPEGASPAMAVFECPVSTAVVITLVLVAGPNTALPPPVRSLFIVVALCAVIPLIRLTADPRLVPEIYALGVLFLVDSMREAAAGVALLEQAILVLQTVTGIVVLAWSRTFGALRRIPVRLDDAGRLASYRTVARLLVAVFCFALVAGAVGYLRLARLLTSATIASGGLVVMLYASVHVLTGLAAFAFRVWPLRTLRMVQHHRGLLERRVRLLLRWLATGFWGFRVLSYVGLFGLTWSLGEGMLGAKLGRGPIQISVGDILEFVLTVWVAYLISAFVRFVLQEDVYPRTRMKRGISYAVSSLLNYVIIALGFVLALGAFGLDLSKVTVLAGAFGVGIGFGLQSVVNNFVSGLILLFERPVHVGDVVEIGGQLSGEVSRIGIRASTVRTWQGAEIIVPNAQFITERVTNWTLSDRTRRIDLRVGVDYGSPPERALEMLEAVGRAHPLVLKSPAPQAFFIEFADSAVTFELRVWCQFDGSGRVQTDLAVAAYAALRQAGMSIPFPQREVRMLHDGPGGVTAEAPGSARPPDPPQDRSRPSTM